VLLKKLHPDEFSAFVIAEYQIINVTGKILLFKIGEYPEECDTIRIPCSLYNWKMMPQ
jgi:hypothetical protein